MIKTVTIPKTYKSMIDRTMFELKMTTKNLAFMLDKNLNNPEFLDSNLYKRLEDDVINSYISRWVIISTVYNSLGISIEARLSMDYITGEYSATWIEE